MPSRCGVLFDVDGTLVDTSYLHAVSWAEALRQAGMDVPVRTVHRAIGMGTGEILTHLLGADRDTERDDDLSNAHMTLYKQWWGRLRPLPGAAALLRECAGRGLAVVLASSASDEELGTLRQVIDADDAITASTGSADADASKPNPDILQAALERADLEAGAAAFVGDAEWTAARPSGRGSRSSV